MAIGCLLDVIHALACIGTSVAVFPVVRRHNEALALGIVTSRMFEAAVIMTGVFSLLAVVTLRQDLGGAVGVDQASLLTSGNALVAVRTAFPEVVLQTSLVGLAAGVTILASWPPGRSRPAGLRRHPSAFPSSQSRRRADSTGHRAQGPRFERGPSRWQRAERGLMSSSSISRRSWKESDAALPICSLIAPSP